MTDPLDAARRALELKKFGQRGTVELSQDENEFVRHAILNVASISQALIEAREEVERAEKLANFNAELASTAMTGRTRAEAEVERLRAALLDVIMTEHHSFAGKGEAVTIARAALNPQPPEAR